MYIDYTYPGMDGKSCFPLRGFIGDAALGVLFSLDEETFKLGFFLVNLYSCTKLWSCFVFESLCMWYRTFWSVIKGDKIDALVTNCSVIEVAKLNMQNRITEKWSKCICTIHRLLTLGFHSYILIFIYLLLNGLIQEL